MWRFCTIITLTREKMQQITINEVVAGEVDLKYLFPQEEDR